MNRTKRVGFGWTFCAIAGFAAACSAASSGGGGFEGSGANAPTGGDGGTVFTSGTNNTTTFNPVGTGGPSVGTSTASMGAGGGCAGLSVKAMLRPLDIYIMLDQSGSMGDTVAGGVTKWKAVTDALDTFVQDPASAGIGVGLGYFGVPPGGSSCNSSCTRNADCGGPGCGPCFAHMCIGSGSVSDSCNAGDYTNAAVEIATLPGMGNAQSMALVNSISMHSPTTGTPTAPALKGAIAHASAWQMANPTHVAVAVLATDGLPEECSPQDIPGIAQIAADGFAATPSIITFVIGVGTEVAGLNAIAQKGGSNNAFIVNTAMNVNMQFTAALNAIRGASLGCNYLIPVPSDGSNVDYTKVNVDYTPGGSTTPETIPQVLDILHCPATGDAWYYDDPSMPTQIIMCPNTCTTLSADTTGSVDVVTGCNTIVH